MTAPLEAPQEATPRGELPEPQFQVLGAGARRHAATPALEFQVHVSEESGRQVYAIALSAQVMIEPARRRYDRPTQERLEELFGPPERWAATTRSLLWHKAETLVPAFTGATTFRLAVPCSFDMELVATKYFYSLPSGEVPLGFNFNGTIYYRADDGRLQMTLVPWSCSTEFRLPVATWRELMEHHYPRRAWVGVRDETLEALQREKLARGLPTLDDTVAALLEERS